MVDIFDANVVSREILGQVLRHLFGKGGYKHSLALCGARSYLSHKIVDLSVDRANLNLGIEKSGRTNDLLDHLRRLLLFRIVRRCADVYDLIELALKLLKAQWTVIVRRGQTEAEIDEVLLSRKISSAHSSDLRQSYVRFVNE